MANQVQHLAYVGKAPWHGQGSPLSGKHPIEVWAQEAGMDWCICEAPVCFATGPEHAPGSLRSFGDQKVLYRSDTKAPLSVVSERYQVVQPREVLEFYRDLTERSGYELETAGVLKAGRKFWALARTGRETALKGGDVVRGYLLLATSCDGTLATVATPTTVRVVCSNTLYAAINGAKDAVKVPHRTSFDAAIVKRQLGIAVSTWDDFIYRMKLLSERKVKAREATDFFSQIFAQPSGSAEPAGAINERAVKKVQALYDGQGRGAELQAAKGTAWGLLNAVTEFVDHERRARNAEYRLDSAWFGQGALLKQRALDQALTLTA